MSKVYNIQVPGEKIWKENRELNMKGELSQPSDVDEAFRAVCALNKTKITDVRALIKDKSNPMTLSGLASTCNHFGVILIIDGSMDFFCVKHQPKGELPIELPTAAGPGPVEEAPAAERAEGDDTPADAPKDERFKEIGSEEPVSEDMKVGEEDEEDLF